MKSRSRKTERPATLQKGVIIPITDPAEQAALDRRCREAEKMLAARDVDSRKVKARKSK